MLTTRELLCGIGVPVVVAALIALVGFWRRWAWAMPVAAGAGFLGGYYALSGVPRLPPSDGTDWLFWAAIPVTGLGVLDAVLPRRWGWVLGAVAGGVVLLIGWPLVPNAVPAGALCGVAFVTAAAGAGLCLVARVAEPRVGSSAVVAVLCVTMGAAAVVVLSSNLRVGGTYGMAASAALGPVAVFSMRVRAAARSVAVVAIPVLAGLLAGGHYYPDPGVSWTHAGILMAAPVLLLPCAALPGKRNWVRGVAAVVLVALAVGSSRRPYRDRRQKGRRDRPVRRLLPVTAPRRPTDCSPSRADGNPHGTLRHAGHRRRNRPLGATCTARR